MRETLSFLDGVVVRKDLGFLIAVDDIRAESREPHSYILQYHKGAWQTLEQPHSLTSITLSDSPQRRCIAVGENGQVTALRDGLVINECVATGVHSPSNLGPLVEVKAIAGRRAIAVGAGRQAYRNEAENRWQKIDDSAQLQSDQLHESCFRAIDGFSEEDVYAVGWEGEIWHFDGTIWTRMASPTNLALYGIVCAQDGLVYICGQLGLLLRGRFSEWHIIDQELTEEDLWSIVEFNDTMFISSQHFLYQLDDDELTAVDMAGAEPPLTCYKLSTSKEMMWSIGAKDLVAFDGNRWDKIV